MIKSETMDYYVDIMGQYPVLRRYAKGSESGHKWSGTKWTTHDNCSRLACEVTGGVGVGDTRLTEDQARLQFPEAFA